MKAKTIQAKNERAQAAIAKMMADKQAVRDFLRQGGEGKELNERGITFTQPL